MRRIRATSSTRRNGGSSPDPTLSLRCVRIAAEHTPGQRGADVSLQRHRDVPWSTMVIRKGNKTSKPPADPGVDMNEIVAYNFRAARELRGWTQEETALQLERFLGQRLPQASIS